MWTLPLQKDAASFYLKMGAANALGNLFKQWFLHFAELSNFDNIEYLLQLSEKHDFFWATSFGPELEQAIDHRFSQAGIFL